MEYKYFTLNITVVHGIIVSMKMVRNKIITEFFVKKKMNTNESYSKSY